MLEIENLSVSYDDLTALRDVSLSVEEGSLTVLLGPNGAGKTTLLKTISGLLAPDSGRIVFKGEDLTAIEPYEIPARGIAHVPEGSRVFPEMTVYDNLLIGADLIDGEALRASGREERSSSGNRPTAGDSRTASGDSDVDASLDWVYDLFPVLEDRETQIASTLSGGEQQMLALGRGLMLKPRLLMLDEPSLGLAPSIVADVFEMIEALHDEGITILLVEQNATQALELADYGFVFESAEVVLEGTADELKEEQAVKQAYLGR